MNTNVDPVYGVIYFIKCFSSFTYSEQNYLFTLENAKMFIPVFFSIFFYSYLSFFYFFIHVRLFISLALTLLPSFFLVSLGLYKLIDVFINPSAFSPSA